MVYNWRIGGLRSANLIEAHPQRLERADKVRWALGRNVKRSLGNGRYDGVEVWTLKERINGKPVTMDSGRSREEAEAWVR